MQSEQETLDDLEGENWGPPDDAPTPMIARCLTLRRTPLRLLAPGDLRLLIGQQIGLEYLVPKALALVTESPLLEADFYPGDLLSALLRVKETYWRQHPAETYCLIAIARSVLREYGTIFESCRSFLASHENRAADNDRFGSS
jgi:CDI immunity proteins